MINKFRSYMGTEVGDDTRRIFTDLAGHEMDTQWVRDVLAKTTGTKFTSAELDTIISVYPPPDQVCTQRHSASGGLVLRLSPDAPATIPRALHVKRCVVRELPSRLDSKWERDVKSYRNEYFFHSLFLGGLYSLGMAPQPIFSQCVGAATEDGGCSLMDHGYLTVVEREAGVQHLALGDRQIRSALDALARFHALTFEPSQLEQASRVLWSHGGYWDVAKRPEGEIEGMPQKAETFLRKLAASKHFANAFSDVDASISIAKRLGAVSLKVAEDIANGQPKCVIHGG